MTRSKIGFWSGMASMFARMGGMIFAGATKDRAAAEKAIQISNEVGQGLDSVSQIMEQSQRLQDQLKAQGEQLKNLGSTDQPK